MPGRDVARRGGPAHGRPAVTHHSALDDLAAAGAEVIADARVGDDDDVITCGGVTAGIDLALALLERWHGGAAAKRAAEELEYPRSGRLHMGPAAWGIQRDGG